MNQKLNLSPAARQAYNAYQRAWKKKNADRIRQYNIDFWERKVGENIDLKVRKLSEKGFSQREISRELNISLGKVNKIVNAE